jgi:hypothetical protein
VALGIHFKKINICKGIPESDRSVRRWQPHCTALVPGVSFTGPVLLVDNTIRTRWTATVAAALLADAGATSVLPLAIHQLP